VHPHYDLTIVVIPTTAGPIGTAVWADVSSISVVSLFKCVSIIVLFPSMVCKEGVNVERDEKERKWEGKRVTNASTALVKRRYCRDRDGKRAEKGEEED
jgi:hypothetical protein